MTTNYDFITPKMSFSNMDDTEVDRFFDMTPQAQPNLIAYSPDCKKESNEDSIENKNPNQSHMNPDVNKKGKNSPILRKVLHELVNHQIQHETENVQPSDELSKDEQSDLLQQMEKLHVSEMKQRKSRLPLRATQVFDGLVIECQEPKQHRMTTRLDSVIRTPMLKLRSRLITKRLNTSLESECNEEVTSDGKTSLPPAKPVNKVIAVKHKASPLQSTQKFMSLAEQVQNFHKETPDRFRSKPKRQNRPTLLLRQSCIPKTPNLTTKFRQRPVHFPDEKQREEMELEEIRKHQIKAYPLNEKILRGPSMCFKAPLEKKPTTVPEPFDLTEVKKKEATPQKVFRFKAQPLPVKILQGPVGVPPKKIFEPTTPHTPHIRVPSRFKVETKSSDSSTVSTESLTHLKNTKVEPFSFDSKIKEIQLRKEENIKKILEEERKAFNSFKAHPVPSFNDIFRRSCKPVKAFNRIEVQPFNLTQPRPPKPKLDDENNKLTPFKARPATVVHQKPFAPKLRKFESPLPVDFHLSTEARAEQRQRFEEKVKKKEEEYVLMQKKQKEEEEELEKQKMLEQRKHAEFKAKPVPKYRLFEVRAADPSQLTMPRSPVFSTRKN